MRVGLTPEEVKQIIMLIYTVELWDADAPALYSAQVKLQKALDKTTNKLTGKD